MRAPRMHPVRTGPPRSPRGAAMAGILPARRRRAFGPAAALALAGATMLVLFAAILLLLFAARPAHAGPLQLPAYSRTTLKNGLTVFVMPTRRLPLVDFRLMVR